MEALFLYSYYSIVIGCIVVGIIRYGGLKQRNYQGILFLLALVLVSESVSVFLRKQHLPNAWVANIYIAVEFLLLTYLYLKALKTKNSKRIIAFLSATTLIFGLNNAFFLQKEFFNSYSFVVYSFVILVFSLEFIRQKFNDLNATLYNDALFWFSTGNIIFYTGNVLVTGFISEWLNVSQSLAMELYNINKILNLVYYLIVGLGLYFNKNLNQNAV